MKYTLQLQIRYTKLLQNSKYKEFCKVLAHIKINRIEGANKAEKKQYIYHNRFQLDKYLVLKI